MLMQRLLDVPEYMLRNRLEYLVLFRLSQHVIEVPSEISGIVVLLISCEDTQLIGKDLVPLFKRLIVTFQIRHQRNPPLVIFHIAFSDVVGVLFGVLVHFAHSLLINPEELALLNRHEVNTIFVLFDTDQWLKESLCQGALSVLSFIFHFLCLFSVQFFVVLSHKLLVSHEFLKILFASYKVLWGLGLVVGDVHVFEQLGVLLVPDPLQVVLDFLLHVRFHFFVVGIVEQSVFLLNDLKALSPVPLPHHLFEFFFGIESGSGKFFSPEGNVITLLGLGQALFVFVVNGQLVIGSKLERPHFVFLQTMVDGWVVRVRRVRVNRLTLDVVVVVHFIIVIHWDYSCRANDVLWLGLERLHSFNIVNLIQRVVVPVR